MDNTIAHLGFIQSIISRMGTNSFLLKGWSVTLVAAIFALSAKDANYNFVLLSYFPVIIFWILDAYFLHQELLYRKLFEEVAGGRIQSIDFTLNTTNVHKLVSPISTILFSKTILLFHGPIIAIVLLAMFVFMKL